MANVPWLQECTQAELKHLPHSPDHLTQGLSRLRASKWKRVGPPLKLFPRDQDEDKAWLTAQEKLKKKKNQENIELQVLGNKFVQLGTLDSSGCRWDICGSVWQVLGLEGDF